MVIGALQALHGYVDSTVVWL